MRIGRDAEGIWENDGRKAIKVMKIEECQISGGPLSTLLGLSDAHLPGIFSAQSFSE
jgi:hypothetical protein